MKAKILQKLYWKGIVHAADEVIDISEEEAKALGTFVKILEEPVKDKMIHTPAKKKNKK